jgi:hypothetical protein
LAVASIRERKKMVMRVVGKQGEKLGKREMAGKGEQGPDGA